MPKLDTLHSEIKEKLAELQDDHQNKIGLLGEQLSMEKKAGTFSKTHTQQISLIEELRTNLRKVNLLVDRWQVIEEELLSIEEQKKAIDTEHEALYRELSDYFIDIGSSALELYRQSPALFNEIGELLVETDQLESDISGKKEQLRQLQSMMTPGSFLGKTAKKGRELSLRGSIKSREQQWRKQLKLLGERICKSSVVDAVPEDSSLARVIAPAADTVKEFRRAILRAEELVLDHDRLENERGEIKQSAGGKNPQKTLCNEVEKLEAELARELVGLGTLFYNSDKRGPVTDESISRTVAALDKTERAKRRFEKLVARVDAAIKIENLEEQKRGLGGKIAELNRKIEEYRSMVSAIEKEISNKQKVVGNRDTLKMPLR